MQPELNRGQNKFEGGNPSVEYSFEAPEVNSSPEVYQGDQHENRELRPSSAEMAPPPPVITPPQQTPSATAAPSPSVDLNSGSSGTPMDANDDDVIEIEWVKIAKQVITQTQDDPRAREKALAELQKDYLMKRYGKVIGE